MTTDLDRLLELADDFAATPQSSGLAAMWFQEANPGVVRGLIQRVKEAERAVRERGEETDKLAGELNRAEARLRAAEEVVEALAHIAQYHPDWKGQRVTNAPNRAQLIDTAFYALRHYDEAVARVKE